MLSRKPMSETKVVDNVPSELSSRPSESLRILSATELAVRTLAEASHTTTPMFSRSRASSPAASRGLVGMLPAGNGAAGRELLSRSGGRDGVLLAGLGAERTLREGRGLGPESRVKEWSS